MKAFKYARFQETEMLHRFAERNKRSSSSWIRATTFEVAPQ